MKFVYGYKTKENESREDVIEASSRDAVYRDLKKKGIRPYRVELAPGIINKLRSIGIRWLVIMLLAVFAVVMFVWYSQTADRLEEQSRFLTDKTRRQLYGDAAVIAKGIRTGWSDVFESEGDRFLASFAIPGVPAGQRTTSADELGRVLRTTCVACESDSIEVRQIKSMVEGMKDEARRYVSAGGTIKEYGDKLVERQEAEIGYYKRAKKELETYEKSGMDEVDLQRVWEQRNDELRAMGIRLIPMPE